MKASENNQFNLDIRKKLIQKKKRNIYYPELIWLKSNNIWQTEYSVKWLNIRYIPSYKYIYCTTKYDLLHYFLIWK